MNSDKLYSKFPNYTLRTTRSCLSWETRTSEKWSYLVTLGCFGAGWNFSRGTANCSPKKQEKHLIANATTKHFLFLSVKKQQQDLMLEGHCLVRTECKPSLQTPSKWYKERNTINPRNVSLCHASQRRLSARRDEPTCRIIDGTLLFPQYFPGHQTHWKILLSSILNLPIKLKTPLHYPKGENTQGKYTEWRTDTSAKIAVLDAPSWL